MRPRGVGNQGAGVKTDDNQNHQRDAQRNAQIERVDNPSGWPLIFHHKDQPGEQTDNRGNE